MFSNLLINKAKALLTLCEKKEFMLATAESCTGGLIAALLTEIPGSSSVVERGFVTYSNEAKETALGVSVALLDSYGAVSQEVAKAMATGTLEKSNADVSIAVTGIAGPSGGSIEKPVGLVYIAVALINQKAIIHEHHFKGSRNAIRLAAVEKALDMVMQVIQES